MHKYFIITNVKGKEKMYKKVFELVRHEELSDIDIYNMSELMSDSDPIQTLEMINAFVNAPQQFTEEALKEYE